MNTLSLRAALALSTTLLLAGTTGCDTESYCFSDCEDGVAGEGGAPADGGPDGQAGSGNGGGGSGGRGGPDGGGAGGAAGDAGREGGVCVRSNGGVEICDSLDNDCDGTVDEGVASTDLTRPQSCGTCANNCAALPNATNPRCTPPSVLDGTVAGTCSFACEPGFYDLTSEPGCEYQCDSTPSDAGVDLGGNRCGYDDDCDGTADEDVNTCNDADNCGACGRKCTDLLANAATATCVTTRTGNEACTTENTRCEVQQCSPGFYDVDGNKANGCELQCVRRDGNGVPCEPGSPASCYAEVCDGRDNDCDGRTDNADSDIAPAAPAAGQVGGTCYGGTQGECATASHAGVSKCIAGVLQCCDAASNNAAGPNPEQSGLRNGVCTTGQSVIKPGDLDETCDNKDQNCNGQIDDDPIDDNGVCGNALGNCRTGTYRCVSGSLVCTGATGPQPETCNGQDDNCDGVIDGTRVTPQVSCTSDAQCGAGRVCLLLGTGPQKVCATPTSDVNIDCDVPPAAPSGATSPCRKGRLACVGGTRTCVGSVTAQSSVDTCGVDANCSGTLTNQPDLQTDVRNCGSCGNDCTRLDPNGVFSCVAGKCERSGCATGYIDCDSNPNTCERACTFTSSTESCDGADNNCNCQIDENVTKPSPAQVCDVSPGASDPNCSAARVDVSCNAGTWRCTFPTGYCGGTAPEYCSGQQDVCDGRDNNCNGNTDENFKPPVRNQGYVGQPCFSDDGVALKHGACQGTGEYECTSATTTACNALKNNAAASEELCDTLDNDCDGVADEPYTAKGTNATYFVKPPVTRIGTNLWMFQYEASRPLASASDPGSGNGYQTSAPSGTPIQRTQACSAQGVLPWFNVTPAEAEQACIARGGQLCSNAAWTTGCEATSSCTYGYAPRGASCQAAFNGSSRVCNIGLFDFDTATAGIQNVLLPTADPELSNCWADWSGTTGNTAATSRLFDIEGNLRELTKNGSVYSVMGGAYTSQSEEGAQCRFDFYTVDANFKLFDTGFRCCFTSDPRL